MLKFYYNPRYKYTNREIIDVTADTNYTEKDYVNIDSPDTINGHIIYRLTTAESIPTYIVDSVSGRRWFVSGITQLNSSKFQISLLRDIISEAPMNWKNEEAYISSGLATDYNKYKRWELPFTNTKIRQERLNFGGKSSFFVFYVNEQKYKQNPIEEVDLNIGGTLSTPPALADYTVDNLNEIPNYEYLNAGNVYSWDPYAGVATMLVKFKNSNLAYLVEGGQSNYNYFAHATATSLNANDTTLSLLDLSSVCTVESFNNNVNSCASDTGYYMFSNAINFTSATYTPFISGVKVTQLAPYVDKIVHDNDTQKYYKLTLSTNNVSSQYFTETYRNALVSSLNGHVTYPDGTGTVSARGTEWISNGTTIGRYNYTFTEYSEQLSFDFTFIKDNMKLPKSAVRCVNIVSDNNFTDDAIAQCLMLAQANGMNLGEDLTTGRILDIQYLPFSVATTTTSNLQINSTNLTAKFLNDDSFSFFTNLTDLTDINKETDTIKIVSPSRASQFLFRPYDNDGNMEFTTKVTLKPYTSVIYVRPSTQGLLMNDWDDKDCLVIEEDFSLTQVNSEWANYVYNNRNYQNAFNRQVQGREFERSWERRVEEAQMKADEWTARNISAQKAQTYTGNLPVLSGVAGAIGTAWKDEGYMQAAQMDRAYNEALYQEGLSIARDNFQYQIENIQSQPLVPSKVTTIDVKFLDGVYLEYYSTNPTEKLAIESFYMYNGNRIDCYSNFASYYGWFVRGKIIKSNNYTQPEIDELNRRLGMGIFTEVNYGN